LTDAIPEPEAVIVGVSAVMVAARLVNWIAERHT
jgi:hypothetical protein